MRRATLTRTGTGDEGTFGRLVTDTGLVCFTGELPWRGNAKGRSCIPPGVYRCIWGPSASFGTCYHVTRVPGRSAILIHAANFVGDTTKGFQCEVAGCIAVGTGIEPRGRQRALVHSRQALLALETALGREPFELTIVDAA